MQLLCSWNISCAREQKNLQKTSKTWPWSLRFHHLRSFFLFSSHAEQENRRECTNYQYQKWKNGHQYWSHGHQKDTKGIIREQLYAHKFDNLAEMDQLLERHKLPILTERQIDNLHSPSAIKEIESIILLKSSKKANNRPKWFCWWILPNI